MAYEDKQKINDPEYIKKSLDTMLGHIDDAAKFSNKKDQQACLDKLIALAHSPEFSQNIGPITIENMMQFLANYKNKVLK